MELLWNKSILELYFSGSWRDEEIAGKSAGERIYDSICIQSCDNIAAV